MSGWNAYTESMVDTNCQEAAIVGYNPFSVWACTPATSSFACITAAQVEALVAADRSKLFIEGVVLGSDRCSLIRDNTDVQDNHVMDLKTKSTQGLPAVNIAVGKTCSALVCVKAPQGVHGGQVNEKCHAMTKYLRGQNM